MRSRLMTALWHRKTISPLPDLAETVAAAPRSGAPRATRVQASVESRPTTHSPSPTEREVQRDLDRVFLAYSSINGWHRTLFHCYLALPVHLRDKFSSTVMNTTDSLESIAESLMLADMKLNAQEVYAEYPTKRPSDQELREMQFDIRAATEDMQYLRSRVDRVRLTIERLEAENAECRSRSTDMMH